MDLDLAEDSPMVRIWFGLALAVLCLTIGFRYAHDRSLAKVNRSLTGGLFVVRHVDSVVDDIDRISIDQHAYLSNGDESFSEDLVERVMDLSKNMQALSALAGTHSRLTAPVASLDHHVNWVLDSVGRSFDVQKTAGGAAAIAYLDSDTSTLDAKLVAQNLRDQATKGVFDRVRDEQKMRSILEVLF